MPDAEAATLQNSGAVLDGESDDMANLPDTVKAFMNNNSESKESDGWNFTPVERTSQPDEEGLDEIMDAVEEMAINK